MIALSRLSLEQHRALSCENCDGFKSSVKNPNIIKALTIGTNNNIPRYLYLSKKYDVIKYPIENIKNRIPPISVEGLEDITLEFESRTEAPQTIIIISIEIFNSIILVKIFSKFIPISITINVTSVINF